MNFINKMFVFLLGCSVCTAFADGEELSAKDIARQAMPATVLIEVEDINKSTKFGTGFFISPNLVVTNYHVVEGFKSGTVRDSINRNTQPIKQLLSYKKEFDIALLHIESANNSYLPISDLESVEIGEEIYVLGNPEGFEGTFSSGIISSIRNTGNIKVLQLTAPISHGSSGGPVLNSQGQVIGIATASLNAGQNLNFAVPSVTATALLLQAISGDGGKIIIKELEGNPSLLESMPHACSYLSYESEFSEFVSLEKSKLVSSPELSKACIQILGDSCHSIIIKKDLSVAAYLGIGEMDHREVRKISRAQFIQGVREYTALTSGRYRAQGAHDVKDLVREVKNSTAVVASVDSQYIHEESLMNDVAYSIFFNPFCKVDIVFTGKSETLGLAKPSIEKSVDNLVRRLPGSLVFQDVAWIGWYGIWSVLLTFLLSLGLAYFSRQLKWMAAQVPSTGLRVFLALTIIFYFVLALSVFFSLWGCQKLGGHCRAGLPFTYEVVLIPVIGIILALGVFLGRNLYQKMFFARALGFFMTINFLSSLFLKARYIDSWPWFGLSLNGVSCFLIWYFLLSNKSRSK